MGLLAYMAHKQHGGWGIAVTFLIYVKDYRTAMLSWWKRKNLWGHPWPHRLLQIV